LKFTYDYITVLLPGVKREMSFIVADCFPVSTSELTFFACAHIRSSSRYR